MECTVCHTFVYRGRVYHPGDVVEIDDGDMHRLKIREFVKPVVRTATVEPPEMAIEEYEK